MSFQEQQRGQDHGEELLGPEVLSPSAYQSFHLEFLNDQQRSMASNFWSDGVASGAAPSLAAAAASVEEDIKGFLAPPSSPSALSNSVGSSNSSSKFPTGLAQKIGYLQMVVQMLGSNAASSSGNVQPGVKPGANSSQKHQKIGRLVDQLLVTARDMFLEQQQQQQQQQQQKRIANSSNDRYEFHLSSPEETMYHQHQQPQLVQQQAFELPQEHQQMPGHGSFPKLEISTPVDSLFGGTMVMPGSKADGDEDDPFPLSPGSFELIELDAMEILAEHTHFCEICGKGFKRDANLRMHMRGHGDEYKTPAALARPKGGEEELRGRKKATSPPKLLPKRYSCPYLGCKRNKQHKKFVPLKTVLCVKNHYRRSHCPKLLTCTQCRVKRFAVLADLKTHEKHCGREKWQCSCGTTFSRKDKLLGHIALFVGHKPLMMVSPQPPPIILPSSCSSSSFSASELSPSSIYSSMQQQQLPYSSPDMASLDSKTIGEVNAMRGEDLSEHRVGEVVPMADGVTNDISWRRPVEDSRWNLNMFGADGGGGGGGHERSIGVFGAGNNNNIGIASGSENNSLSYLSLDFFDCKN